MRLLHSSGCSELWVTTVLVVVFPSLSVLVSVCEQQTPKARELGGLHMLLM